MSRQSRSISSDVGLLAAAAVMPGTLQQSMIERDAVDQGLATGLTMALAFSIAILMQDGIEAATNQFIDEDSRKDSFQAGILASGVAVGIGLIAQRLLHQTDSEQMPRSIARTLSYWMTVAGAAGVTLRGLGAILGDDIENGGGKKQLASTLFIFPLGVLLALLFDFVKYRQIVSIKQNPVVSSPAKALTAGIAIIAGLTVVSRSEKYIAHHVQKYVDSHAKPLAKGWLPIGHVASVATLAGIGWYGISKLYRKIESSQNTVEKIFSRKPDEIYVSGSTSSHVSWQTLSLQGRRHIGTRISKQQLNEDLHIKNALEPIRIYVGYDSAPSDEARTALALAEIDRTKALDRKYVVLIAPTGTGYVNYVISDTVEYLAKGDCAMITMQYSKRPSPLSLDRVDDGHIQFRILVNALSKRLRNMPKDKRPQILMFGESLGAWVSQDAFLYSGTDGLIATGIDRALWIGTPELSRWQDIVNNGSTLNVDHELVAKFDNIADYRQLPASDRKQLRYVMCTHHNDPVAHFSLSLLVRRPRWLSSYTNRPKTLPQNTRYRTPTTFVLRMIDMKNALKPKPGIFTSVGHDYRADLLDFINEVYGFHYTVNDLNAINALLVRNDKKRGNM